MTHYFSLQNFESLQYENNGEIDPLPFNSEIAVTNTSNNHASVEDNPTTQIEKSVIGELLSQFNIAARKNNYDAVISVGETILTSNSSSNMGRSTYDEVCEKTAHAYLQRGKKYQASKDYENSIAYYTRAMIIDPYRQVYFTQRETAYHEKEAGQNNLPKRGSYYYYARGINCLKAGREDLAIVDFNRAIELTPDSPDYFYQRGISYLNRGQYDSALVDFNQAIKLDVDEAAYYWQRSITYSMLGRENDHQNDIKRASALGHERAKQELYRFGWNED